MGVQVDSAIATLEESIGFYGNNILPFKERISEFKEIALLSFKIIVSDFEMIA